MAAVLLPLLAFAGPPAPQESKTALATAKQIRELTPEEAKLGRPVHIRGVVTYYDPVGPNLFVQDATAGIWVGYPPGLKSPPTTGQLLDLEGVTGQGFTPYIAKAHWRVLGTSPMPKPRVVSYADIATSSDDSQWVEMQGIVRSFVKEAEDNVLVIDVTTAGGSLKVRIPGYNHPFPMELVDANVQFHGVCGTAFNRQAQLVAVHLFTPSTDYLKVIDPAPAEPFDVPVSLIANLGRFSARGSGLHRIKVQGFVTAVMIGSGMYIKDETGGLYVQTQDDETRLQPGDEIEAVGFPATGEYTPVLRSARFRPMGPHQHRQVIPIRLTAREALLGKYDAQLVQIEGVLQSERSDTNAGRILTLESGNVIFHALIDKSGLQKEWPVLQNGSRLRLTGICTIKVDENGNPSEFRIYLRTSGDLDVLARPSWLTTERLLSLMGGLAGLLVAAFIWAAFLRRRMRQQTAIIRKQVEIEAALEQRHRRLVENAPYGIAALDERRRLLDANPAFRHLIGLKEDDDLSVLNLRDVLRFSMEGEQEFDRALQDSQTFQHLEVNCVRRDTTRVTLSISGRVVHDDNRGAATLEIIAEDITSKRHLEQQLLQAYKLEAVGRLAGGVAHDFNNLLIIIQGYAAMLTDEIGTDTEPGRRLHAILEAAKRAAGLTHQLLAYSRKQVLEPKVLELDPLIRNLDKMLRRLIREDIEFSTKLHGGGVRVRVDPNQLEQVLINLAVNARDAMPSGGRLTIRTEDIYLDEGHSAPLAIAPGPCVLISVTDTGAGMDRRTQEHIFEPFFTTKEVGKGTGLGLSMVYGIVRQSGGAIQVESALGRGATFRIYLPAVEEHATSDAVSGRMSQPPKGRGTILVVEDEAEVRRLLCEALNTLGYTTVQACNGAEALKLVSASRALDMAVCDMIMPTMSGGEFRERLLDLRPDLPVLLISGYAEVVPEDSNFFNDTTQFLRKPFDPKSLGEKVREMMASRGVAAAMRDRAASQKSG